jgi:hypothetical protein
MPGLTLPAAAPHVPPSRPLTVGALVRVQAQMYEVAQHGIEGAGDDWSAYDASRGSVLAEAQARGRAQWTLIQLDG